MYGENRATLQSTDEAGTAKENLWCEWSAWVDSANRIQGQMQAQNLTLASDWMSLF